MIHRVCIDLNDRYNENRHYWKCDCGCGGSVPSHMDVDIAADNHIKEGETRIDVSRPAH